MKKFRFIMSFIFSLIFMLLLVVLEVSLFTRNVLLQDKFYINRYESSGVYSYAEEAINKNLRNIGRTVNLPAEVFEGVVSKEWIKEQVDNTTAGTIEYMKYKRDKLPVIEASKQVETFNKNLDSHINKLNLIMDKNVLKEISSIKKEVETSIKSQAGFIDFTSASKAAAFQKARKILNYVYNARDWVLILIAVSLVLIFLINIKSFFDFIRWPGYSLIAAGLILAIPAGVGIFSKFAYSAAISETVIKNYIASAIEASLKYFMYNGLVIFAAGLFITLISVFMENKRNYRQLSN